MTYIDPVEVSSDNYKLLHDEKDLRILEMRLPAGTSDVEHSHPAEIVYFVKGGKVAVHVGGESMELEVPDGHTMTHEAWTHRVENVGETDIHAIIVERKS